MGAALATPRGCLTPLFGVARPVRTCPASRIAAAVPRKQSVAMAEPVIERDEAVALLFNVSDIVMALERIERILSGGDDDGEEEVDES